MWSADAVWKDSVSGITLEPKMIYHASPASVINKITPQTSAAAVREFLRVRHRRCRRKYCQRM